MSPKLPDISEWYTEKRAIAEDADWLATGMYRQNVDFILLRIQEYGIKSVIEWGCGTGLVAAMLPEGVNYYGCDKNAQFLALARGRNPLEHVFVERDARKFWVPKIEHPILSMAWAFLKHFGLDEWDKMAAKIIGAGDFAAFGMQVAEHDFDDGTEFHHVFVQAERVRQVVARAGHTVEEWQNGPEYVLADNRVVKDVRVWTEKAK